MLHIIHIESSPDGFIISDSMGLVEEFEQDEEKAAQTAEEIKEELSADRIKWL